MYCLKKTYVLIEATEQNPSNISEKVATSNIPMMGRNLKHPL